MHPTDLDTLRAAVHQGARLRYLFFWKNSPPGGPVDAGVLSQWAPVGFTVDGVHYPTAEHWMMAEKARLFGDAEHLALILAADHPAKVQALGRKVRGFDAGRWHQHRRAIVTAGSRHKFGQNTAARAWLLGTEGRVLVEASPVDRIWGIGLAADQPEARDPLQWRGLNLLGFALMDARRALAES